MGVLDTPSQAEIDALVQFGRKLFTCAVCGLSLVDHERLWFKSVCGIAVKEIPRDISLCTYTIEVDDHYAVENALEHPLHQNNPLVTGGLEMRAYLGVPVRGIGGHRVGSFCIIDTVSRKWTAQDVQNAREMAALAEILLRRSVYPNSSAQINSDLPKTPAQGVFTAMWRRNLAEHVIELDLPFAQCLGLGNNTRVNKDWFTRQVLDCDKERVYEARGRADGEPFRYHLGLHTGQLFQITERVEIVRDGDSLVKIGLLQVCPSAVTKADDSEVPQSQVEGAVLGLNQGCMLVHPDLSLVFAHPREHASGEYCSRPAHRLMDILRPDQIADALRAMQYVRKENRKVDLRLELNLPGGSGPALYDVAITAASPSENVVSHGFEFSYRSASSNSASNALVDEYNREHVRAHEATAGWIYRESLRSLHVSSVLSALLGIREGHATLDELLLALQQFTSQDCGSLVNLSRHQGFTRRVEFSQEVGRQVRWYQLHTTAYLDAAGKLDGFCGFLTDITETRAAQREALNTQYAYDLVIRSLSDGVLEFDAEGRLLFLDKFAKHLLTGIGDRLRPGAPIFSIFSRLRQERLQQALSETKFKGVSERIEIYLPETRQHVSLQCIASLQKILVVLRDLSSAKKTEREKHLFELALSTGDFGVLLIQHTGLNQRSFSLRYCNQKLSDLLNLRINDLAHVNLEWLMHRHLDVRSRRKLFSAAYRAQDVQFSASFYLQPGVEMGGWVSLRHVFNPESSEMDMLVLTRLGA
ncbi:MAG TPA: GAF domain-containing protein [Limnobacter sp.]|nr:GAF domain-containing protein [Limnobacter sp.]